MGPAAAGACRRISLGGNGAPGANLECWTLVTDATYVTYAAEAI